METKCFKENILCENSNSFVGMTIVQTMLKISYFGMFNKVFGILGSVIYVKQAEPSHCLF